MRCSEVTQELSTPTGGLDPAELDRHLASCRACSAWAERAARFDRIWAATRPAEAPDSAFDEVWARVKTLSDFEDIPAVDKASVVRFPRWGRALAGFAAAAAVLAMTLVLVNGRGKLAVTPGQPNVVQVFEAEPGKNVVLLLNDNNEVRVVHKPVQPFSEQETVAADYVMLSKASTMASLGGL